MAEVAYPSSVFLGKVNTFNASFLLSSLLSFLSGDKAMSRYFTIKVTVQAMSLLACAILQVYLLRTLFEKKFARSFV